MNDNFKINLAWHNGTLAGLGGVYTVEGYHDEAANEVAWRWRLVGSTARGKGDSPTHCMKLAEQHLVKSLSGVLVPVTVFKFNREQIVKLKHDANPEGLRGYVVSSDWTEDWNGQSEFVRVRWVNRDGTTDVERLNVAELVACSK